MPSFDLRGIKVAKYVNTGGTISYTDAQTMGDAMSVNLELRFAEGRLYAESTLAEYMRKAVGGTISIGVKYIPEAVQKILFGSKEKTRSISVDSGSVSVKSLITTGKSDGSYVGVAFYAPDRIDGAEKYTCVKIARAMFGMPSMSYQTAGENIQFNTPTTSGEFLADHSDAQDMLEIAICDTEAAAQAWCAAVLV